jgi:rhodanese-related sulfurtransferase
MTRSELKGVIILLTLAVVTAVAYNSLSPNGIPWIGQWNMPKQGDIPKGGSRAVVKSVDPSFSMEIFDPAVVEKIIETKKRLLIDVRHRDFYDMGHLPGALSFPLADFDQDMDRFIETIDRKHPLLVYCSGLECPDSHTFAKRLIQLNYSDVKIFSPGFNGWEADGRKIETNE